MVDSKARYTFRGNALQADTAHAESTMTCYDDRLCNECSVSISICSVLFNFGSPGAVL